MNRGSCLATILLKINGEWQKSCQLFLPPLGVEHPGCEAATLIHALGHGQVQLNRNVQIAVVAVISACAAAKEPQSVH